MRTVFSYLMILTLILLILVGMVIAGNGELGPPPDVSPYFGMGDPGMGSDFIELGGVAEQEGPSWQGHVVGDHVLLWLTDADPLEILNVWVVLPDGALLEHPDRWPLVLPAIPGVTVLVVRRPDGRVHVHPYLITVTSPPSGVKREDRRYTTVFGDVI